MRTPGPSTNARQQLSEVGPELQPAVESEVSDQERLDWLARERLLADLRSQGSGVDWPGWSRTTISGSKVQRPAFRRRASESGPARRFRNLFARAARIKTRA
jgi:hypothetical protein